jgi:hypothetical protein
LAIRDQLHGWIAQFPRLQSWYVNQVKGHDQALKPKLLCLLRKAKELVEAFLAGEVPWSDYRDKERRLFQGLFDPGTPLVAPLDLGVVQE